MKEIVLGIILSFLLEDKLILAIDKRWSKFFDDELKFQAKINVNGKIVFEGPKVRMPSKRNQVQIKEVSKNE